jgi:phosphoribosylformylglycinamidine cyclo-ligase
LVRSVAHITGGGFHENVPRALPDGLGVELTRGSWTEPPIFSLLQRSSGASDEEMFSTFNMGVGMVLVVAPEHVDEVLERGAPRSGASASLVGVVTAGAGVRVG